MKICLIRPPRLMEASSLPVSEHPPFGLALLAGVLLAEGHEVSIIDGIIEAPKKFNKLDLKVKTVRKWDTEFVSMGLDFDEIMTMVPDEVDVIGFSAMFSPNWLLDRELIDYVAERRPKARIIAGGESVTAMIDSCFAETKSIEVCVLGEAEESLIALLEALENDTPLDEVDGIAFRKGNEVVKTKPRKRIRTLESVPFPPWELFHVDQYQRHQSGDGGEDRITLPILATRGCPYRCTFCTSPDMWGTRYFMRRPEHVVEEFIYLNERFGATNFEFYDLTAIVNKKWIIAFCKLLQEKNLDFTWKIPAGTRSEAIDQEVADNLYNSGCFSITYAPESGSTRMLEIIKKKVILSEMLSSIKASKKANLHVMINMIIALPEEKHIDVWKTLFFLVKSAFAGVDDLNLAVYRPYPGSVLFTKLSEDGHIDLDHDDFILESLSNIDNPLDGTFFNDHISPGFYRFYYPLFWIVFYAARFMKSPKTFFRFVRNIANNTSSSLVEQLTLHHLRNLKSRISYFFKFS